MNNLEEFFRPLFEDKRKFLETLLVIEDKNRKRVPFKLNEIQSQSWTDSTDMDITVKPAQVGFSSYMLARRFIDTVTTPGTNTVLIAYEDFITERLLMKTDFYYNHLAGLRIPGFPKSSHDSSYEKVYEFVDPDTGRVVSKSSIYIASARSKTAARAEVIHHLLADEFAFWVPEAVEKILLPGMDRVPAGGTIDIFSTCNGEGNSFHTMYVAAKQGKSTFKAHFYPWFQHSEYQIKVNDVRTSGLLKFWDDIDKSEFKLLDADELELHENKGLSFDQIRWRRWKIKQKESLMLSQTSAREDKLLFKQEFPEDDVSCFLSAGNMFFDEQLTNKLAATCYPAPHRFGTAQVWYKPDSPEVKNCTFEVSADPGQGKNTDTAINVMAYTPENRPILCAIDKGRYLPELACHKMVELGMIYNHCKLSWEANSHGLGYAPLLKSYRPIYYREEVNSVTGKPGNVPGWLTTAKNKEYMLNVVHSILPDFTCHSIDLVQQMRGTRYGDNDKIEHLGLSDILMSCAINLVCHSTRKVKRGLIGANNIWSKKR